MADSAPPRLTYLRIQNFRALRDLELRDLSSLTVLVGPNGSGKSTVLDALAFLGECANGRLQEAWQSRKQKYGAVKSIGGEGEAVKFEVRMEVEGKFALVTYLLEVDELSGVLGDVVVIREQAYDQSQPGSRITLINRKYRAPKADYTFLIRGQQVAPRDFTRLSSVGSHMTYLTNWSEFPIEEIAKQTKERRKEMEGAAVVFLYYLLTSYRYIHFTDSHTQGSALGEMPQLTTTGDNLRNVLFYLWNHQREAFDDLLEELKRRVPRLAEIEVKATEDQRILLYFRDAPFPTRIPDRAASDGTLRLLAYLTLLREPKTAGMLGIEEPEGELHPKLLYELAEAFEQASFRTQLFVATHSPEFLNALSPEQVWVLERAPDGYTRATRADRLPGITDQIADGAMLGWLWIQGYFGVGDPLNPPRN
jgi:predicted ATPase